MPIESPTRFVMVPARRSDEPTARKRARRILGALFLAAGLSVVATLFALGKGRTRPDLSAVDAKGRDLAYTAAVNYVTGAYQNVPHASTFKPDDVARETGNVLAGRTTAPLQYQSLSWVGFTPEHFGSKKSGLTDFEVHHFLVVLANPSPTGAPGRTPAPGTSSSPAPKPTTTSPVAKTPAGKSPKRPAGSAAASPGIRARTAPPAASTSASPAPTDSASAGTAPTGSAAPEATPSPTTGPNDNAGQAPAADVVRLDVPVLITPQGPRLAATPAFSVWTGGVGGTAGVGDYTNYSSLVTDASDAVKSQVAAWAKAYATGDSAGLLALTGDQNNHHRYLGLSGFTLAGSPGAVQMMSAIKAARGQLVVRVRILLARAPVGGTVSKGNGATQQFATFADFDLLVGAPAGAQPPILAWGPAGSAAELEPYSNALRF